MASNRQLADWHWDGNWTSVPICNSLERLVKVEPNDQLAPPAFIQEISNFLRPTNPRWVVASDRKWMEPYNSLEETEIAIRAQTRMELGPVLNLWLQAIALFSAAFSTNFEWPSDLPADERPAFDLREDLLGLAGGSSKFALDGILDGYYWFSFGMIRSLLETCRRVGYIRLRPLDAPPFFEPPTESPIGPDGAPRKNRQKPIDFDTIKKAFAGVSDDEKNLFDLINAGIIHMHGGSHPSGEGTLQIYLEHGRKTFGPVFDRYWASFGLKWGGFANLILLSEVLILKPQSEEWIGQYRELGQAFSTWQQEYNKEFPYELGHPQTS